MFFASNLRGLVNFFPTSSLVQLKVSTRSQLTVFEEVKNFLNFCLLRRKKLVRLQVHQDISFKSNARIALALEKQKRLKDDWTYLQLATTAGLRHCGQYQAVLAVLCVTVRYLLFFTLQTPTSTAAEVTASISSDFCRKNATLLTTW